MHHDIPRTIAGVIGLGATETTTWHALRRFEQVALPIIETIWTPDQITEAQFWSMFHAVRYRGRRMALDTQRKHAIAQLRATLGDDAGPCAAALVLHPQLWAHSYESDYHHIRRRVEGQLLTILALDLLSETPFPDRASAIARRIVDIALGSSPMGEPNLAECVNLLLTLEPAAGAALLDTLTAGDYPAAWRAALDLAQIATLPDLPAELTSPQHKSPQQRLSYLWQQQGNTLVLPLIQRRFNQGQLNPTAFQRFITALPQSLPILNHTVAGKPTLWHGGTDVIEEPLRSELARLTNAAIWPLVSDLRPETWPTLQRLSDLRGGRFLLRLLEEIDRLGLTRLTRRSDDNQLAGVIQHLLSVTSRRPDEDDAALVPLLRQIGHQALQVALPHTPAFTAPLCMALGWEAALPLITTLRRLEGQEPNASTDPTVGVIHSAELRSLADAVEPQQLTALLEVYARELPTAITLLQAARGENRSDLRRQLGRRKPLAARALGLLPLTAPNELEQRYLMLTRFRQEVGSSPAGRRPYERAAAEAGLRNLALNAGYSDLTRLELAMEARIGASTTAIGRVWQIEGYTLTLELHEGAPALRIDNGKRTLKRRPALISRDYAFREVQATLAAAQDQSRRYRDALVEVMRNNDPLSPEELDLLRANPIAADQLSRLVLIDAAGAVGCYCPEGQSLAGLDGKRVPISGAVHVAHPYTLAQLGLLEAWQTAIVQRRIVQPFKQVFRELYVLTSAEIAAGYASGRLAGRRIRTRQALAILSNLGWVIDGANVERPSYHHGIAAHMVINDGGADDGINETTSVTGEVCFWPLHLEEWRPNVERRIPLTDIPPLVLSEALRDLDMVTAVAYVGEEGTASREVLQRRGELVQRLADAAGLRGVRVEERAVLVQGALAGYRVNLATGATFLTNGQYLCIVPAPKDQKAIYLPFADGGEPLTSEIISKVLLLSNDHQIRDPSILSQIGALRQAA